MNLLEKLDQVGNAHVFMTQDTERQIAQLGIRFFETTEQGTTVYHVGREDDKIILKRVGITTFGHGETCYVQLMEVHASTIVGQKLLRVDWQDPENSGNSVYL